MSAIKHILVPHDFSETGEKALAFALELCTRLGARMTVMHAYEVPVYGFPDGVVLTAEVSGQIERAAKAALAGVASRCRRPGLEVGETLRQGPAWSEIDDAAKELGVDLIVMGTHGRKGVARALLGSVTEKVVRTAPCPVLTVHG